MSTQPASATVLIIEDEHLARRALVSLLLSCGYQTTAYESAEAALLNVEVDDEPVVALVDVDLPGMNGFDLIARLEQHWPRTRVVLVTAAETERLDNFRKTHDTVQYLPKPVDFTRLLGMLMRSIPRG